MNTRDTKVSEFLVLAHGPNIALALPVRAPTPDVAAALVMLALRGMTPLMLEVRWLSAKDRTIMDNQDYGEVSCG